MSVRREWVFAVLWLLAIAVAVAIRMPRLGLRPMHADEAVQAARFRDLWLNGDYLYDPTEYHGPTLIYATLPSVMVGGAATFADTSEATYRAVPVAFGVGLLFLFWLLRDALGRAGKRVGRHSGGLFTRLRVLQPLLHSRNTAGILHAGHARVRLAVLAQRPTGLVPGNRSHAGPDAGDQRNGRHCVSGRCCRTGGSRGTRAAR